VTVSRLPTLIGKLRLAPALLPLLAPALARADEVPVPDKGDTAWMLTATVLVILMTIPGLALFYGGMSRSKNVLSLLMQVFMIFCMVSLLWTIYGYSLAFTNGNAFIGGFDRLFLQGMTTSSVAATFSKGVYIPEYVYFVFQLTFACITPALIVGAFAERIKFCGSRSPTCRSLTWCGGGPVPTPTRMPRPAQPPPRRQASCFRRARSTSREARWCTSTPASQAWSAP
jgi:uncharacterized protein with PQ loop repeat